MEYEKFLTINEYIEKLKETAPVSDSQALMLKAISCPFYVGEKVEYFALCTSPDGRELVHPMSKKYFEEIDILKVGE